MKKHWYRVEMMTAGETYSYIGSSRLPESEVVKLLGQGHFVELDDLTYFDEEVKPRRWTEWDRHCVSRIHLNPRYVLSVLPLVDDPRQKPGDGSKVLKYPDTRPPQSEA